MALFKSYSHFMKEIVGAFCVVGFMNVSTN